MIPGIPTDGLKPADLLWASLLDKPLLFPPSAHSHGSGDLPGNIAFKDQANTFTANQTVTGTITASGFSSALKYQLATATAYGTASVERMAVNDYDMNFGIKIQFGSSHKFTFSVDQPTGYWYSNETKPRWAFRQYGTNEVGHGLVLSNAGVDVSLSGDYSANLNVRNSVGNFTGINAGNITASGAVQAASSSSLGGLITTDGTTTLQMRVGWAGNYADSGQIWHNGVTRQIISSDGVGTVGNIMILGDYPVRPFDHGNSYMRFTGTGRRITEIVGWDEIRLGINGATNNVDITATGTTIAGTLIATGHVTAGIQSLSTDPTGSDLASGQTRTIKNTSTGTTKVWLNDGGTFKSLAFV